MLGLLMAFTLFCAFAPPLSLALAGRLRGVALATVLFTGLFRACLEALRALGRVIGFPFRAAGHMTPLP
jgi:hypothetical protein